MPCAATTPLTPNVTFTPIVTPPLPVTSPGMPSNPSAGKKSDELVAPGTPPAVIAPMSCDKWPVDGYDSEDIYYQKVSNNFTLGDLTIGGKPGPRRNINQVLLPYKIKAMPTAQTGRQPCPVTAQQVACHLTILATNLLDPIDEYIKSQGWVLRINSGFRSNPKEGDHGVGLAADLSITNKGALITETQRRAVMEWILANHGTKVRQILFEKSGAKHPGGWIHVSSTTPKMGDRGASKVGTIIGPNWEHFLVGLPGSNGYTLIS